MYDVYLDKVLLPIAPSKIQLKIKNQNKTVTLINEGEINILKQAGLTDITLSVTIPQINYPFASYVDGYKSASFFLDAFEELKTERDKDGNLKPFQFIISRTMPNGDVLFENNMEVALEDYTITEDANNGFDLLVDIKLKQYRPYSVKTVDIIVEKDTTKATGVKNKAKATIKSNRSNKSAPKLKTYTVAKGDSLWAIAQKCLGNGNRYPEIYKLNQSIIDNRNKGTGLSKYTIYAGQTFTLPS